MHFGFPTYHLICIMSVEVCRLFEGGFKGCGKKAVGGKLERKTLVESENRNLNLTCVITALKAAADGCINQVELGSVSLTHFPRLRACISVMFSTSTPSQHTESQLFHMHTCLLFYFPSVWHSFSFNTRWRSSRDSWHKVQRELLFPHFAGCCHQSIFWLGDVC